MRVIAGAFRGRVLLDSVSGFTHPMSEKMRGAVFNALGDIEGLTFLDAFSGTGMIGIEALSRGVSHVTAIDNDPAAYKCITANVGIVGVKKELAVICANIATWLKNNPKELFNVIVADPPYTDIDPRVLRSLAAHLKPNGILVVSLPAQCPDINLPDMIVVKSKTYAGGSLRFYKQAQTDN